MISLHQRDVASRPTWYRLLPLALISAFVGAAVYASLSSLWLSGGNAILSRPVSIQDPQADLATHHMHTTLCTTVNATYKSSALEERWMRNMSQWQHNYCGQQMAFTNESQSLDRTIYAQSRNASDTSCAHCKLGLVDPSGSLLSHMSTSVRCGSSGKLEQHVEEIEPLFASLRGLWAVSCPAFTISKYRELLTLDYLVLAHASYAAVRHAPRKLYFDLGAEKWEDLSQGPLIQEYRKRGIEFDRILLWDKRRTNETFKSVPAEYLPHFQFFEMVITADMADKKHNPLHAVLKLARPEDFVVFKLDIDNYVVEEQFYKAIMANPALYSLIDEFFWEQHFNFPPYLKDWSRGRDRQKQYDASRTLSDVYATLMDMRRLGIRAHGWP